MHLASECGPDGAKTLATSAGLLALVSWLSASVVLAQDLGLSGGRCQGSRGEKQEREMDVCHLVLLSVWTRS